MWSRISYILIGISKIAQVQALLFALLSSSFCCTLVSRGRIKVDEFELWMAV